MREHLPWLCQGDIFAAVPVLNFTLTEANELEITLPSGPAVLLTHDCAMDKRTRSGEPTVERLQFARLRAIGALPIDRQQDLRNSPSRLTPYTALYLDEVGPLGESFILLDDPYYLPASYFTLWFRDYPDHPNGGPDARYVTPQDHDTRMGCLDEAQVELLQRKMIAFWARVTPEEA